MPARPTHVRHWIPNEFIRVRALVGAVLSLLAAGCQNVVDLPLGPQPPYLAIVVLVDVQDAASAQGPYTFHVKELSGTTNIDTTFRATTRDTSYFSVKPAEYHIDISEVPASCGVRGGSRAYANVMPNTNTTLVRFYLACRNALNLSTVTIGTNPDSSYAYLLTGPGGVIRTGELAANDTVLVDDLGGGTWEIELRLVKPNCVVTSDGGERAPAVLSDSGGASHRFIVRCSDVPKRPQVLVFKGTYQDGAVAFFAEVVDKERDIDNYTYNITNCRGLSVLPNKGFYLYALRGALNVSYADTARIIGGFDVDFPVSQLRNLCQSFWVGDGLGNTTPIIEIPLVPRSVIESPVAQRFNAVINGTTSLAVDLAVSDQNGDYVGCFVTYVLRDGIVTAPLDGKLDWLVFQPAGIVGSTVPTIALNIGYGTWSDYYGARVYLVDRAGNMTRLEDLRLVQ